MELTKDSDLCEKLDHDGLFNDDWCYYFLAIKKNNKSICDLISEDDNEGYKEDCLKIEE